MIIMCSIAGFSLSQNSKVNPRKLAHALLVQMDSRGNQAAGYAWQSSTGSGVYKKDTSGASLSTKQMSKGTRLAVLHTRYATHGTIKNMANNHPVLSPDRSISLVHNGVIYNHKRVREDINAQLPEVDTSVIPAILQQYDRDITRLEMLDGDASIAWLDEQDRLTLRIARVSHSPLCVAQLQDGSLVFASTDKMLLAALEQINQPIIYMENLPERVMLVVRDGRIDALETLPETHPDYEESYSYNYHGFRNMTSGGHSSTPTTIGSRYSQTQQSLFVPNDWYDEDYLITDYPSVDGYTVNEYGEYYSTTGEFMGTFDDMVEYGFIEPYDTFDQQKNFAEAYAKTYWNR